MTRDRARHSVSYSVQLPTEDGYNQIPSLETLASDLSLTRESSSEDDKRRKTPKKVRSQMPEVDEIIVSFDKPIYRSINSHGNQLT